MLMKQKKSHNWQSFDIRNNRHNLMDGNVAFLFPGQGVQYPSMGSLLYQYVPRFSNLIDELDDEIKFDFSSNDLLLSTDENVFSDEVRIQIAVFLVNAGYDFALKERKIFPNAVYGYSSGIYSAICSSEAISFSDSLFITQKAGEILIEKIKDNQTGMIAITGLREKQVKQIIEQAKDVGSIAIANINSDRQFFLSGEKSALEKSIILARQPGLLNVRWLPVSVPYHCSLIKEAAFEFSKILDNIVIKKPKVPIVDGSNGNFITTSEGIKDLLKHQLVEVVNFPVSISNMISNGITEFWEVGPNSFLFKLLRRERRVKTIKLANEWLQKQYYLTN